MTNEEAIFCEKSYIGETNCTDCKYYGTDTCQSRESHRMAVKALEQESTTKNNLAVDAVSRADVLKLMQDNWHTHNGDWAMQESMDDIRALPSVTPQEPQTFKWCTDCKEYDQEKHCCHRWSKAIRDTVEEMKQEYIEREVLDKIRFEIESKYNNCDICEFVEDYDYEENDISEYRPIGDIADILEIIDKYKGETEE